MGIEECNAKCRDFLEREDIHFGELNTEKNNIETDYKKYEYLSKPYGLYDLNYNQNLEQINTDIMPKYNSENNYENKENLNVENKNDFNLDNEKNINFDDNCDPLSNDNLVDFGAVNNEDKQIGNDIDYVHNVQNDKIKNNVELIANNIVENEGNEMLIVIMKSPLILSKIR